MCIRDSLKPMLDQFDTAYAAFKANPDAEANYAKAKQAFQAIPAQPIAAGQKRPKGPADPDPSQNQHNPTVLFNAMIHPVLPYAIRGVIWYQGESIVGGAAGHALYPHVQETLIGDWRQLWGEGDFPFYICLLYTSKGRRAIYAVSRRRSMNHAIQMDPS